MRIYISILTCILAALFVACGGTPNTNNTNGNVASVNANNPLGTTKAPETETINNAPTLGPVVQAYYDALKKKNDAAVREVMSADFLKRTEEDMKTEKRKDLTGFLAEYDTIPDKPLEVRNEKIEGEKGVADLRGGAYKTWTAFAFVKEGGKWKLTGGSPAIDSVKQQANSK